MITPFSEDGCLIRRAGAGDATAFEVLVRRYERPIFRYISRIMHGHPDDAADLAQETFLRFYRALDRMSPDTNLSAWLYRVARNCCISELRKRWTRTVIWDGVHGAPLVAPTLDADPESVTLRREADAAALPVLARLPPHYRLALLHASAGRTSAEIGVALGISPNAAKIVLYRARGAFRRINAALAISDALDRREANREVPRLSGAGSISMMSPNPGISLSPPQSGRGAGARYDRSTGRHDGLTPSPSGSSRDAGASWRL